MSYKKGNSNMDLFINNITGEVACIASYVNIYSDDKDDSKSPKKAAITLRVLDNDTLRYVNSERFAEEWRKCPKVVRLLARL